ncbi:CHAP domain-containing protein [Spirochaetia bacterium 38H-sp]|uniref:CHAP domain-containing protein n=1 Tax=Rarispira pelagica TaxID=3141764 RepID=A0ABU9U8V5_9SPIR
MKKKTARREPLSKIFFGKKQVQWFCARFMGYKGEIRVLIVLLMLLLFSSCTSISKAGWQWPDQSQVSTKEPVCVIAPQNSKTAQDNSIISHFSNKKASFQEFPSPTTDIQRKLLEEAKKLLGKNTVDVRGRHFNLDCTGVVLGIYYGAGIDLSAEFPNYSGNGVKRLYEILKDRNLLYTTRYPQPGDLIFWDNTYDANGNGRFDDYLTHVGMVMETRPDGTIIYIHHHLRKGIVLEQMNLNDPDTYTIEKDGKTLIINSPMRRKGDPRAQGKWLASQLTRDFAQAYKYK